MMAAESEKQVRTCRGTPVDSGESRTVGRDPGPGPSGSRRRRSRASAHRRRSIRSVSSSSVMPPESGPEGVAQVRRPGPAARSSQSPLTTRRPGPPVGAQVDAPGELVAPEDRHREAPVPNVVGALVDLPDVVEPEDGTRPARARAPGSSGETTRPLRRSSCPIGFHAAGPGRASTASRSATSAVRRRMPRSGQPSTSTGDRSRPTRRASASSACSSALRHLAAEHAAERTRAADPGERDRLANKNVRVSASSASASRCAGATVLRQRVDALEALAVVRHRLADAPEVVQRERRVLVPAIGVDRGPVGGDEVAVRQRSAFAQRVAHLVDGRAEVVGDALDPRHARGLRRMSTRQYGSSPIGRTASQPPQSKNRRSS